MRSLADSDVARYFCCLTTAICATYWEAFWWNSGEAWTMVNLFARQLDSCSWACCLGGLTGFVSNYRESSGDLPVKRERQGKLSARNFHQLSHDLSELFWYGRHYFSHDWRYCFSSWRHRCPVSRLLSCVSSSSPSQVTDLTSCLTFLPMQSSPERLESRFFAHLTAPGDCSTVHSSSANSALGSRLWISWIAFFAAWHYYQEISGHPSTMTSNFAHSLTPWSSSLSFYSLNWAQSSNHRRQHSTSVTCFCCSVVKWDMAGANSAASDGSTWRRGFAVSSGFHDLRASAWES